LKGSFASDGKVTPEGPRKSNSPRGIERCFSLDIRRGHPGGPRKSNSPRGIERARYRSSNTGLGSPRKSNSPRGIESNADVLL